eukprot:CAMPEP_0114178728 /NCGR_PEP_ID=MMETSP0043_2-20121206/38698_1 /TAXON_ID=464988 /ORGANISM="Hemiselmis andersenii, Strain CCMP644" /LENGTH=261 /DNA_ID=CAMNT_0001277159 /DNA_START=44 /DNA_END=829 /DNA_ORIENTATION=-
MAGVDDGYVMVAKTDNCKGICSMLSAILLKKDIVAFCVMDRNGFKFTVEMAGALQASVYLKHELFTEYRCTEKQQFGIQMSHLLECLNIFGGSSNSYVSHPEVRWRGPAPPARDGGRRSAELQRGEHHGLRRPDRLANPLRDALSELDWWGGTLTLEMSTGTPTLRMYSKGEMGGCVIEFPPECDPFDECACTEDTREDYRFSLLQCVLKALALSDKACLRVNRIGMLSVQLMIRNDSPVTTFVEFLICADANEAEFGDAQ